METGVMAYSANPARVPGLVRIWSIVEPDPALAPVMPPVTVPMVQLKSEAIFEVRLMPVPVPEQIVRLEALVTVGTGFTVRVKLNGVPVHPLAAGVTVIVAVTGEVEALAAVKEGILPDPDAARPIEGALLVQV